MRHILFNRAFWLIFPINVLIASDILPFSCTSCMRLEYAKEVRKPIQPALQLTIESTKTEFRKGESVEIKLRIHNQLANSYKLSPPEGSSLYKFYLYLNGKGKEETYCPAPEPSANMTPIEIAPQEYSVVSIKDFRHRQGRNGLSQKAGHCGLQTGRYEFFLTFLDFRSNRLSFVVN